MSNHSNNNWFKISIFLVIIIISGFYYFTNTHKENLISSQKTCAERSEKHYKEGGYDDTVLPHVGHFINHWNSKLNKCFMLITVQSYYSVKETNYTIENNYLEDSFEGKTYGAFHTRKNDATDETIIKNCTIQKDGLDTNSKTCLSREEFDEYANPLMNE